MKFRKIVAMATAAAAASNLVANPSALGGGISQTVNAVTVSDYTYEITPLLAPFNQYFYLKTDNPDPKSFRIADKDSIYVDSDETAVLEAEEAIFSDVEYEDETTWRVNGGYIFYSGVTDGGEVVVQEVKSRDYWGDPEEWGDTDIKLTLPKLSDYLDYLVDTYGKGNTFFEKLSNIQSGLSEICLYSGSYIRGEVVRAEDYWALSSSPHVDQTLYIQSPYTRDDNKPLFASYLYPYIADSLGFPSIMASVAGKLDSTAEIKWSETSHAHINVTLNGETKVYGGQGNGKGQGLSEDKITKFFKFDGTDNLTLENLKALLDGYSKVEMENDIPQTDNLTWSKVTKSVGSGEWVSLLGITSVFGMSSDKAFTYLYKADDKDSYATTDSEVGGSLYWGNGSLGTPSNVWVDGRYINNYEVFEPGAKFEDHPTASILLKLPDVPTITYTSKSQYNPATEMYETTYEITKLTESEQTIKYEYSTEKDCWETYFVMPVTESLNRKVPVEEMVEQGILDKKYLDMLTLTREEVEKLGVDRNTNNVPTAGLIYDGTAPAGTSYELNVGDVNLDGEKDMKDIAALEQYLNNPDKKFVFENVSDTNHDNRLNNKDLALLEQFLNGYNVNLQ